MATIFARKDPPRLERTSHRLSVASKRLSGELNLHLYNVILAAETILILHRNNSIQFIPTGLKQLQHLTSNTPPQTASVSEEVVSPLVGLASEWLGPAGTGSLTNNPLPSRLCPTLRHPLPNVNSNKSSRLWQLQGATVNGKPFCSVTEETLIGATVLLRPFEMKGFLSSIRLVLTRRLSRAF